MKLKFRKSLSKCKLMNQKRSWLVNPLLHNLLVNPLLYNLTGKLGQLHNLLVYHIYMSGNPPRYITWPGHISSLNWNNASNIYDVFWRHSLKSLLIPVYLSIGVPSGQFWSYFLWQLFSLTLILFISKSWIKNCPVHITKLD